MTLSIFCWESYLKGPSMVVIIFKYKTEGKVIITMVNFTKFASLDSS